jgi:hypothetical protein
MATVHFTNAIKLGVEMRELPTNPIRTALHLLVDTKDNKGQVSFSEVVIMWSGDKESLMTQLNNALREAAE